MKKTTKPKGKVVNRQSAEDRGTTYDASLCISSSWPLNAQSGFAKSLIRHHLEPPCTGSARSFRYRREVSLVGDQTNRGSRNRRGDQPLEAASHPCRINRQLMG